MLTERGMPRPTGFGEICLVRVSHAFPVLGRGLLFSTGYPPLPWLRGKI